MNDHSVTAVESIGRKAFLQVLLPGLLIVVGLEVLGMLALGGFRIGHALRPGLMFVLAILAYRGNDGARLLLLIWFALYALGSIAGVITPYLFPGLFLTAFFGWVAYALHSKPVRDFVRAQGDRPIVPTQETTPNEEL